ncbi:hypothetical protein AWB68_03626 [Caballeronia choica]|uniref:Uncharacterized protein n=1 Tax=Caballeronia choica TaxID=326476 RepID=A0A158J9G6_9BURK|nr:hypothetical protein AWB68_03626 [Caballeronia choica]
MSAVLLYESRVASARQEFVDKSSAVLGNGIGPLKWIFEHPGNRAIRKRRPCASAPERSLSKRDLSTASGTGFGNVAKNFVEHGEKRLFQIALQNDRVLQLRASHGAWIGGAEISIGHDPHTGQSLWQQSELTECRQTNPKVEVAELDEACPKPANCDKLSTPHDGGRQEKTIANIKKVPEPTGLQPFLGGEQSIGPRSSRGLPGFVNKLPGCEACR